MAPLLSVLVVLMAAGLSHAGVFDISRTVTSGPSHAGVWDNLKIDCGVSVWSAWGPTTNGVRTRTRQLMSRPLNGGAPCPHLTETDMDPWTMSVPAKASKISNSLVSGMSNSSSDQTTPRPRDFLFIVDMSGSISPSEYLLAKTNLAALIGKICGEIGLGIQNKRAAVITYSDNPVENFDFDDHTTTVDVQNAFRNLPRTTGRTCTGDALNYAQSMFDLSKGARPDSQSVKEVVLLTDGNSNCGPDEVVAALDLKNIRSPPITMFVFAIGNKVNQTRIDAMASSPPSNHLFHFADFHEFNDVVARVVDTYALCAPIEIE